MIALHVVRATGDLHLEAGPSTNFQLNKAVKYVSHEIKRD